MKPYIITTDTTADLPKEYLEEHGIGVMSLNYIIEGTTYDWEHPLPVEEFYAKMRGGSMPTTSQVNPETAKEIFSGFLAEGVDVLHIAFSSALSGSYNSARIAAEELKEEQPKNQVVVVDSLCASLGEGLLVHKAVKMKEAGKSLEETAAWVEQHKLEICHNFTVDDLFHLHRGGRVSKATAILGTMINIKPVLHVDDQGRLINIDKVRGRRKSLNALVDRMEQQVRGFENDTVFISDGDCLEEAQYVAEQVKKRFGITEILINHVGPTIGAHSGPGTMALFFMGQPR